MSNEKSVFLLIFIVMLIHVKSQEMEGHIASIDENSKSNTSEMESNEETFNPFLPRSTKDTPAWHPIVHESEIYVDLIFLLDGSGSVTHENFTVLLEWIKSVSLTFDISTEKFQIGVVQYSHWYRIRPSSNQKFMRTEIALGVCGNRTCLNEKLDNIRLMGFTTYTGFAINKTVNEDFRHSRNYRNSTKILVLVTDGKSQDEVVYSAEYARKNGITIFSIGVGSYDLTELQLISTGEMNNNLQIYRVKKYQELETITDSLQREIKSYYIRPVCPPLMTPMYGDVSCNNINNVGSVCSMSCDVSNKFRPIGNGTRTCQITPNGILWTGRPATCGVCDKKFDLLLILDSSSSVHSIHFDRMKRFVAGVIDALPIGRDHVQVSCIMYNQNVYNEFDYNTYLEKKDIFKALRIMRYSGEGAMTGKALRYAVENKFDPKTGRRQNVPHITLLITDGKAKENISESTKQLHGISRLIAVGINNADQSEIDLMNSDPDVPELQEILPSYSHLLAVENVWKTVNRFCEAVKIYEDTFCINFPREMSRGVVMCDSDDVDEDFNDTKAKVHHPVGTICKLVCQPGFKNSGQSSSVCNYFGEWTKVAWSCKEKNCNALRTSTDGVAISCKSGTKIDSACTSRCRPGYSPLSTLNTDVCGKIREPDFYRCVHTCRRRVGRDPVWDSDALQCENTRKCDKTVCPHGRCVKKEGEFYCNCFPGFTGLFCEVEINECEFQTCYHGTCKDLINAFQCECDPGFEGTYCEVNINECSPNPCLHGGDCTDGDNRFFCECSNNGYDGLLCEHNINDCASSPCRNNGKCRDGVNSFTCDCKPGFSGRICQRDINECAPEPCLNGGNCTDAINGYKCSCVVGYKGHDCGQDVNECASPIACENEARCRNTLGSYSCQCVEGFTGKRCEENINDCEPNPCINSGHCQDVIAGFVCECPAGYTGKICEMDVDECDSSPCIHEGTCINGMNEFSCHCAPGYTGTYCEVDVDECASNPCGENGFCQENTQNSFVCKCAPGFTGMRCEVNIDDCEFEPCVNNGTCVDEIYNFSCSCTIGFTGTLCEVDINECDLPDFDCNRQGVCSNTEGGFYCHCEEGYYGIRCEYDTDDCENITCESGYVCVDQINSYICECPKGMIGDNCAINLNDCDSDSCENDGECVDGLASYSCLCMQGYTGDKCETYIGYCDSHPCHNGGECILEPNGYRCNCSIGFHGFNCESDIDECTVNSSLCKNGAICINTYGGFNCSCIQRYWGPLCDKKLCHIPKLTSEFGELNCSNGEIPGSECKLLCPKQYRLKSNAVGRVKSRVGETSLTCFENGTWTNSNFLVDSPPSWECELVTCPPLEDLSMGGGLTFVRVDIPTLLPEDNEAHIINCTNGTNVGSTCRIKCHGSFSLSVQEERECRPDGTWTGFRWKCLKEKCLKPLSTGSSHYLRCFDNEYSAGSTCVLQCSSNFKPFGAGSKKCSKMLEWEPDLPWGCREVKCPSQLPEITNGRYFCSDGERPGSVCVVRCAPGFVLNGEGVVICEEMGLEMSWKGNVGTCKPSECDFMINLQSGVTISSSSNSGFVSLLRKPYRYNSELQYQSDGELSCNMKTILAVNITEGELVSIQFWYGESVTGFHTVISTNPQTTGYPNAPSSTENEEYTLAGVGTQLLMSGFIDDNLASDWGSSNVKRLSMLVEPKSRVNLGLDVNQWSWKSRGGLWRGDIVESNMVNVAESTRMQNDTKYNVDKKQYSVYLGLNRVPNQQWYYDYYRNGTGETEAGQDYICRKVALKRRRGTLTNDTINVINLGAPHHLNPPLDWTVEIWANELSPYIETIRLFGVALCIKK